MLTVPPLDEGSSMGTADTGPVRSHSSAEEASSMNDHGDWGVVTEAGVLICDGEEGSPGEEADAPPLLSEGENGLQLSFPGTDSVPTIVESIEMLPPTEATNKSDSEEVDSAKKKPALPSDFQEKTPSPASDTIAAPVPSTCRFNWMMFLLFHTFALLCVTSVASISQRHENQQLYKSNELMESRIRYLQTDMDDLKRENEELAYLEEDFNYLKQDNERLTVENQHLKAIELEVLNLKKENERMKLEEELRWEDCQKQSEDTVLVDNCWLTAKANVQLGGCAKEATDTVKDFSSSIYEQTSAAFAAAHETSADAADEMEETVAKIINKVDSLGKEVGSKIDSFGKALWKGIERKSSTKNEFFSKMDDTAKSWFKDSLLGLYTEGDENEGGSTQSTKPDKKKKADSLDDVVKGLSEMMMAGETFMNKALEKAAEAMDMSQTELLEAAKQAFEEASMAQHVADKK